VALVRRPSAALLAVGILIVAANLRAAATSVGPMIHQIRDSTGLSAAGAGALLTLPALCFGLLAPVAPLLAGRLGVARAIGVALAALVTGLLIRPTGGLAPLYLGTALAAAGIAVGNVLLPVVVKRDFPHRIGLMGGLATTALVGVAALAAGVTVPLARGLGLSWRGGLAVWAIPAAIALVAWSPQLAGGSERATAAPRRARPRALARDRLAWQVTLFFGLTSCGFYAMVSWLPSIFQSHGISSTEAGLLLATSMAMGLPAALVVPALATRRPDQRALAAGFSCVTLAGYLGLLLAPASGPWLWAVLVGLGQGACFPLALTLIVLRSADAAHTAGLSTLTQGVGYVIAAAGPLAAGALHDATGSWTPSLVLLVALIGPQIAVGLGAGRDLHVARLPALDAA
jgi:MFS transporter, CP family, cyanate transporter